jgi:3-deoxy-D-manno-octulosonate 8-phosphate phosphatase (KDO 8-P phosphatase)
VIANQPRTLQQRCREIELLLLDVDGVLTDGSIVYGTGGVEIKAFHVRDGSGLKLWHLAGKRSGIITGRSSEIVNRRAAELGIGLVLQGQADKLTAYERVLQQTDFRPEQICYVGDDLPDLPVLRACGLAVAPADGCAEARNAAHHVTGVAGGRGAVREVIELILAGQGRWQDLVSEFAGRQ